MLLHLIRNHFSYMNLLLIIYYLETGSGASANVSPPKNRCDSGIGTRDLDSVTSASRIPTGTANVFSSTGPVHCSNEEGGSVEMPDFTGLTTDEEMQRIDLSSPCTQHTKQL